jgi:hypothetical protein
MRCILTVNREGNALLWFCSFLWCLISSLQIYFEICYPFSILPTIVAGSIVLVSLLVYSYSFSDFFFIISYFTDKLNVPMFHFIGLAYILK